jgi:hypothetical protein
MGQNWPGLHKYAYSNCTVRIAAVRVHGNAIDGIHLQDFRILTHVPRRAVLTYGLRCGVSSAPTDLVLAG